MLKVISEQGNYFVLDTIDGTKEGISYDKLKSLSEILTFDVSEIEDIKLKELNNSIKYYIICDYNKKEDVYTIYNSETTELAYLYFDEILNYVGDISNLYGFTYDETYVNKLRYMDEFGKNHSRRNMTFSKLDIYYFGEGQNGILSNKANQIKEESNHYWSNRVQIERNIASIIKDIAKSDNIKSFYKGSYVIYVDTIERTVLVVNNKYIRGIEAESLALEMIRPNTKYDMNGVLHLSNEHKILEINEDVELDNNVVVENLTVFNKHKIKYNYNTFRVEKAHIKDIGTLREYIKYRKDNNVRSYNSFICSDLYITKEAFIKLLDKNIIYCIYCYIAATNRKPTIHITDGEIELSDIFEEGTIVHNKGLDIRFNDAFEKDTIVYNKDFDIRFNETIEKGIKIFDTKRVSQFTFKSIHVDNVYSRLFAYSCLEGKDSSKSIDNYLKHFVITVPQKPLKSDCITAMYLDEQDARLNYIHDIAVVKKYFNSNVYIGY